MTIRSMTGFGSSSLSHGEWLFKVEARSVNHRALDARVWAPREWGWVEPLVRTLVTDRFHRGRIEVRVDVEQTAGEGTQSLVDRSLFLAAAAELDGLANAAGLEGEVRVADVLAVVGRADPRTVPDDVDEDSVREVVATALDALQSARRDEGSRLDATFRDLLSEIESAVAEIETIAPTVVQEYEARLLERVRSALERFGVGDVDERVVVQEVAMYADRSDVSEEIQRARSHVAELRKILDSDTDEPVGKKIDFYLQELMRESNTTGSKSASAEITGHVVRMKSAVEKLREQAANVE